MSYKLAIYIKTYSGDFLRIKNLLRSIQEFNIDDIPVFISCPRDQSGSLFSMIGKEGYTYIPDEYIFTPSYRIPGWEEQMLVKLNAWKNIDADNLLIIDSDAEFVREFYLDDFIAYDNVPYTIMHENKQVSEYEAALKGGDYSKTGYVKAVLAYRELFGGKSKKIYDYGPNPHLWSRKVLESFEENYLKYNDLTMENFCFGIKSQYDIHFRETLTYGEYLLAGRAIDIVPCGPFFKTYHWKEMWDFEEGTGLELKDNIKKSYLGIIKQSNWS